mgnify:CR=1 FL=1
MIAYYNRQFKKCLYGTNTEYSNNELLLQVARLEEANLHIHSNSTNIHEGVECKYAVLLLDLSLLSNTLLAAQFPNRRVKYKAYSLVWWKLKQLGIFKDIKTNNWLTFSRFLSVLLLRNELTNKLNRIQ